MFLNSIKIEKYKLLEDFEVNRLGRVNLIVGKNNSGKSTVLECLRILASNGVPNVINEIVDSHDDILLLQNRTDEESIYIYEGLFTDRTFPRDESSIYIGNNEKDYYVKIKRLFYQDTEVETKDYKGNIVLTRNRKFIDISDVTDESNYDQTISIESNQNPERPFFLSSRSFFLSSSDRILARRRSIYEGDMITPGPISYIPTQFLSMDSLASLWDKAVLTPYFENVKKFLKIISEDFEDVAFIKVPRSRKPQEAERTGIMKLKNKNKPIPLNGMGDGILRILQLVLGIFPATNGFLLIDEFENGLHYSVQEQVWRLIFQLSKELNIQVFATTHSWDCIEAFSRAANDSEESALLFRIGKSVKKENYGKIIATLFDKNSLNNLKHSDVELR